MGTTGVSQGNLTLNFNAAGAAATDILSNASSGVVFAGGTLTINAQGATNVNRQSIATTAVTAGGNTLSFTTSAAFTGAGALNVALGEITRAPGTGLTITAGTSLTLGTAAGNVTTTTVNTNGILGGAITTSGTGITTTTWAVSAATQTTSVTWDGTTGSGTNRLNIAGLADRAQVSFSGTAPGGLVTGRAYYVVGATATDFQVALTPGGTPVTLTDSGSTAVVNRAGVITGLAAASYLTTAAAGNTAANYLTTSNVDVTSSPTLGGPITINSLRFSSTTAQTLTLTGVNVINSGGILVSSGVGNVATAITGGTLQGATGAGPDHQ
ncbi:MAG: hypothetical protein QM775_16865 [Pirellulales bacterium]